MILLAATRHHGQFGILMRSAGPQVRGGESVSILRIDTDEVACIGDRIDLLAALDWRNIERFSDELPLDADSLILLDQSKGAVPIVIENSGARRRAAGFGQRAAERPGGRANMVAVGEIAKRIGLPLAAVSAGVDEVLSEKDSDVRGAASACIEAAFAGTPASARAPEAVSKRWRLSGNAAAGVGALRAGVGFVAAYPITPASEMLEWLAPRLERTGGTLIQAEDELAAVNMLVGASFGGIPALTATSGPGLSLMSEGIGLAIASETPIVVVDVARGGPSTGMPTKSEQADLDQALYGLHGDAPHLVLAALSIGDCAHTVEWAVRLAERLQTAAIVLSDQALGQTQAIVEPPPRCPPVAPRKLKPLSTGPAQGSTAQRATESRGRYCACPDGISPMPLPGNDGGTYTADGLTHDQRGVPSSSAADHHAHLEKLRHKLLAHDYGNAWARFDPAPALAQSLPAPQISLITWGSSWGATHEAATRLRQRGVQIQVIGLRLIAPLRTKALRDAIGQTRVLVIEVNASGQLFRYLNAQRSLPRTAESFARPGPLPLRPLEIITRLAPIIASPHQETGNTSPATRRTGKEETGPPGGPS
jgi:2-oxoglutarate ferredoxin oxidoreductase subunit alpha